MAKQDNTNTEEEVAMEVMPGADPLTEEEKGEDKFENKTNFEIKDENTFTVIFASFFPTLKILL